MCPVVLMRLGDGRTICCPAFSPGRSLTFSASVLAGDGHAIAVEQSFSEQHLDHGGDAAGLRADPPSRTSAGLEVREQRHTVADALEIVDRQRHVDRARHGDQMQHGVRGSAQDRDQHHGVLESLARHDVARLQVEFQRFRIALPGSEGIRRASAGSSAGVEEL